jgi:hypothetical protein
VNSPLGEYAPVVSALVCGGTIATYLLALVFNQFLEIDAASLQALQSFAILAFGAVVGSAVAVNGWKQPLVSAHERIDALEMASKVTTHPEPVEVK